MQFPLEMHPRPPPKTQRRHTKKPPPFRKIYLSAARKTGYTFPMKSVQPAPLADQFASLRAAVTAHPGRSWLPNALEAMIIACLARIFDQLAQLVRLWQAGALPPLPIRTTAHRIAHQAPMQPHGESSPDSILSPPRNRPPQPPTAACNPHHATAFPAPNHASDTHLAQCNRVQETPALRPSLRALAKQSSITPRPVGRVRIATPALDITVFDGRSPRHFQCRAPPASTARFSSETPPAGHLPTPSLLRYRN